MNKNYGFRDVVVEWAKSFQYYVDKCLETEDDTFAPDGLLEGLYENSEGFLRKICEYNKDLEPEKRIRVWGGDMDHSNTNPARGLIVSYANRIKNESAKNEILNFTEEFSRDNIPEDKSPFLEELGKASNKIKGMMEENRNSLPDKNFDAVIHILKSFEDNGKCYSFGDETNKFWDEREKMMLKYFEEAYEKSDGKILGIYGGGHVWKAPEWWEVTSLRNMRSYQ